MAAVQEHQAVTVCVFDYEEEATRIVHACLFPMTNGQRWANKILERPELKAAICELAYQMRAAEQRGREAAERERAT